MNPSDVPARTDADQRRQRVGKPSESSLRTTTSPDASAGGTAEDSTAFRELLERAASGDPDAASRIVRTYEPEIRRFIRVRLASSSLHRLLDSVDIVQSVFARLFREGHVEQLADTDPQRLLRLLMTMARNRLIDHARSFRSQRHGGGVEHSHSDQAIRSIADCHSDPADVVAERELLETVRLAMGTDDRALLDERLSGCDWNELSHRFDASPEALRKRCTRAVDRAARDLGLIELSND